MRQILALVACLVVVPGLVACRRAEEKEAEQQRQPTSELGVSRTAPIFVDRARESGFDFVHFNGMTGKYYYPEMMGGGGAMLDFDVDGDLDLYLVQGSMPSAEDRSEEALFPPHHQQPYADRLYRNDLTFDDAGALRARFEDVTSGTGIEPRGYGMGIAAGDVNNDGLVDLYRTAFGANQLLQNNGDGTFSDITRSAAAGDHRWSVPAVLFDYDLDGWLDLYIGNYLDYTLATHKVCRDASGAQDYCGPTAYPGVRDRLLHNRGDGSFDDVSVSSGVGTTPGKALGALAVDLTEDGWPDLYVANDGEPNFLWINQKDGTFVDEALWRGCAVSGDGLPQASMGVDAGDFDNDGDFDLFMTHLTGESNTLFRNDGGGSFTDISSAAGLSVPSWSLTGFGTHWADFDNDGWLDLLTLNGAVRKIEMLAQREDPYPLHQKKQLYRSSGLGRFDEIGDRAGEIFQLSEVGRGAAFGDIDNDGDVDVLAFNSNGPARLLVNEVGSFQAWLGLSLVAAASHHPVVGARLLALRDDGSRRLHRIATDGSYASANDPRIQLGSGFASAEGFVSIASPGGDSRRLTGLAPFHYHVVPEIRN